MRRRSLVSGLAVAVATAAISSAAIAGPTGKPVVSADGNSQSIGAVVTPKRLYQRKFSPAALEVTTKLRSRSAANGVPVPTTDVRVDFDKGTRIFTKGIPTCRAGKLQNVSTEIALRECRRARIGQGTARALLPIGERVFPVKQTVTAFNGQPKGNRPVVLLHSYGTTPVQTTLVLVGTVRNYDKQGFGPRLDVTVPLIANGAGALTDFRVKIDRKYRWKGKRRSFLYAKCPRSNRLKVRSVFKFLDGQTTEPTYRQTCQRRPEGRGENRR